MSDRRKTVLREEPLLVIKIVGAPEEVRKHRSLYERIFSRKRLILGPIVLNEHNDKAHCFVDVLSSSANLGSSDNSETAMVEKDRKQNAP